MMETSSTLNSGMCRCCSSEGTFKDIKTKYHWMGEEEIYADMLTECFDIKIQTPENMDNGICEVCITQLRNAVNFKKQVLHTEEQFKKRLQGRDFKNPIKLESVEGLEEHLESDQLSDPDFSGAEFDIPIKEEKEEKPKAKKRQAKPAASRAKKPKAEAQSSAQSIASRAIINKKVSRAKRKPAVKKVDSKTEDGLESSPKDENNDKYDPRDIFKHVNNVRNILLFSDATPIRRHTGLGYVCAFCDSVYKQPKDLKQHTLENHKNDSEIETFMKGEPLCTFAPKLDLTSAHCDLCNIEIVDLEHLLEHLKNDHDKDVDPNLNNHILPFKFDNETLRCAICDKDFAYFKKLQEHISVHYRNFLCNICSAPFVCRSNLQKHKSRHKQGEFPCSLCERVFDTKAKKADHEKFVHYGDYRRSKCPLCSEKFVNHDKRMLHMAEVHGEKPLELKCKACPLTFSTRRNLTKHTKRDHLMERPHQCPNCDKKFFIKRSLTQHMVKHTGEKEYICDICNKAYARKTSLREHMRIHYDDRRFACNTCGEAFIQKCSLKGHMMAKHGQRL